MAVELETFVKHLTDSGVLSAGKLEVSFHPEAHPKDAQELAKELVRSKTLTRYQAQEVYLGRARSLILGNYTILDRIGAGGWVRCSKPSIARCTASWPSRCCRPR